MNAGLVRRSFSNSTNIIFIFLATGDSNLLRLKCIFLFRIFLARKEWKVINGMRVSVLERLPNFPASVL